MEDAVGCAVKSVRASALDESEANKWVGDNHTPSVEDETADRETILGISGRLQRYVA